MSLLTPERVPVKVYRWDDVGAPALDKTPNCMATIFKACLVTGYGTKEGAGWTMPFEDAAAGIKVFRPEVSPHTDFYLRCSGDTGTQMAAQVYLNMTDINTGDLKLECATPFKYAKRNSTPKWVLIVSPRGFWFFCVQGYKSDPDKTGAYFYCGDTTASATGDRLVYLQHTGGTFDDGDSSGFMGQKTGAAAETSASRFLYAAILKVDNTAGYFIAIAIANGSVNLTNDNIVTPPIVIVDEKTYMLPGVYIPLSGAVKKNLDTVTVNKFSEPINCINFSTSSNGANNLYIATDEWVF